MSEADTLRARERLKKAEERRRQNPYSSLALQELQRAQAALDRLQREETEGAGQERLFEETP